MARVGEGGRPRGRAEARARAAAVRLIERHGDALFATARRYALSREDAEDAFQRGLEILLTRAPRLSDDELLRWVRTVVKHEAFAIWRGQDRTVPPPVEEWERAATLDPPPDQQVESYERLRLGAEAIRRLKPQEIRALTLRAEGHSYQQICEITGWSYTKVNRCLTEGRRRFFEQVAGIESGAECERLSPLLSAFADGEATAVELTKLRPHLRGCLACRAALRAFRELPHRAAEVVPLPTAAEAGPGLGDAVDAVWRWGESAVAWTQERVGLAAAKAQAAVEASSASKAAAVAASATALAGGAVVGSLEGERGERPAVAGAGLVLDPPAPEHLLPRVPSAAVERVALPVLAAEPVAVEPAPLEPAPPAPAPASEPAPPSPAATDRSRQLPDRVATPVRSPGESALAGVEEGERETAIDPMTEPSSQPMEPPGPRDGG